MPVLAVGVGLLETTTARQNQYNQPTLGYLREHLRRRLNDTAAGNYTNAELDQCLNEAYVEAQTAARSYRERKSVTIATGTHTYSIAPMFEPLEVYHNSIVLDKVELTDNAVSSDAWDAATASTPTKWMFLHGSYLRIAPPPSAAADDYPLIVMGYSVDSALVNDTDIADGIPAGLALSVMLDRAEEKARRMRPTRANNLVIAKDLLAMWTAWATQVEKAQKGR